MNKFKKLVTASALGLGALSLGAAADAAVMVSVNGAVPIENSAVPPVLGTDGTIEFFENELSDEQVLSDVLAFTVGDDVDSATIVSAVQYGGGVTFERAGILNFGATYSVNGTQVAASTFTDAAGQLLSFDNLRVVLDLSPGDLVEIALAGTVFEFDGFNATYRVGIDGDSIDVIPVPAAGLLFGTAAIGGVIARRRRKTA